MATTDLEFRLGVWQNERGDKLFFEKRPEVPEHAARNMEGSRTFHLSAEETRFARGVLALGRYHLYRTADGEGFGDFVLVDQTNPSRLAGFVVEHKGRPISSQAGWQLRKATEAAAHFRFGNRWEAITGNTDELLAVPPANPTGHMIMRGRSQWGF